MKVEIVATSLLARHAAARIAALLTDAVEARGTATLALSGGSQAAPMLAELAERPLPWDRVHLLQVDERIAPDGHADRNLTLLEDHLLAQLPTAPAGVHPMPVAAAVDDPSAAEAAVSAYAATLREVAGNPVVLDVVHLGLGDDGHTASLVPGDPVLTVDDVDVAATAPYRGRRRLTLTYPALARARALVWLVEGGHKAEMVQRLVKGDRSIPAGRVHDDEAALLLDPEAAGSLR